MGKRFIFQAVVLLFWGTLSVLADAASETVIIQPKHAALLPIPTDTPMHYQVACKVINNSYPSSVAVSLGSPVDPKQQYIAKINGNPLIQNNGYLTRKENDLVIQPLASGWHKPTQLKNRDDDILIQVMPCVVVNSSK